MGIMIEQRAQLLQTLGSIATSAADTAAKGIAEAAKTDSKTVDTALKVFGGFDRSEFENVNAQAPNLLTPAVRPPASYEGPAEYFKPLSNIMQDQGFLVPAKDLLQQLEDPRFQMADGLSGFSDNRITQTLMQKGVILNSKSGAADPGDMAGSLDSFGKLYSMENTVAKQLQLHDQLDLGALGRLSAPKVFPLPTADNPKLNQGLKGMPDAQALTPQNTQDLEIRNLPLDHALNGTPETVGEMEQMANVLRAQICKIDQMADLFGYGEWLMGIHERLTSVKEACKLLPSDFPPNQMMLDAFTGAQAELRQFEYFTMVY